jgi:hypothetical protein
MTTAFSIFMPRIYARGKISKAFELNWGGQVSMSINIRMI